MRLTIAAAAMAASLTVLASPAQAQLVNPSDPELILSVASEAGLEDGRIILAQDENPYLEVFHSDLKALILFMNCDDNHKNCKTLQYYMGFSDAEDVTLEMINQWNRERRFGRAYIDDVGDPVVEMDVDLDFNGIPRRNLVESFSVWMELMDAFRDHLFD